MGYGVNDASDIMKHPFFESIDWNKLKNQEIEPPLKINLKSPNDIKYFDPHMLKIDVEMMSPE